MKSFTFALVALFATAVVGNGSQPLNGPCSSDADCETRCCGLTTGLCAGAIVASERDGVCGFGTAGVAARAFVERDDLEFEEEFDCDDGDDEESAPATPDSTDDETDDETDCGGDDEEADPIPSGSASATPANGGPAFDPAGVKNVGNGQGQQFIGGQCLSTADCQSGCCAGPSGICSGPGASLQNGKTGCGFPGTSSNSASSVAVSDPSTATPSGVLANPANGGPAFDPAGVKNVGNGQGQQFIGGQCLSTADCESGCCALPSGICSGPGAAFQAGKQGCGFPGGASSSQSGSGSNKAAASSTLSIAPEEATAANGELPPGAVVGGEDPNAQIIPSSGEGSQGSGDNGDAKASTTKANNKAAATSTLSIAPEEATAANGELPPGAVAGGEEPNAQIIPSSGEGSQGSGDNSNNGATQSSTAAQSSTTKANNKAAATSTLSIAPEEATAANGELPPGAVAGGEDPNAQIIPSSGEGSQGSGDNSASGASTTTKASNKAAASSTLSIAPEEATAANGELPPGAVAGGEDPNAQIIPSSGEGSQGSGDNNDNGASSASASASASQGSGQASSTLSIAPEEATAANGELPPGAVAGGEEPNAQIIPSSGEGDSSGSDSNKGVASITQGSGQATPTLSIAPEEATAANGELPPGAVAGGQIASATIIPSRRNVWQRRGNGIFTASFEA